LALALCLGIAFAAPTQNAEPKLWALLVAGSNTWGNYRHQADVYHAYQILHSHGIPDENIIVMHYDDLADNTRNPTKGVVINHPDGDDVYHNVPKDYVGKDVTAKNFISILTGDKDAMKNIGSGKVIESGPNDHVFVNYVDHGNTGILGFPTGPVLTVKQLTDAITKLHNENRYAQLVFYVEACESGSMFKDVLPNNINVFATTASDYDESSYACYYDTKRQTYLGDWYSVNWMEDSDVEDLQTETLQQQFEITKNKTKTSHVMQYGDLTMGSIVVGQFQGKKNPGTKKTITKVPFQRGAPSFEVPLDILYRQLAAATNAVEKQNIMSQIENMIEKRALVETTVKKLIAHVAVSRDHEEALLVSKPPKVNNLECHDKLVHAFNENCFSMSKHQYAMKFAHVLANMCESGLNADNVISQMLQVCSGLPVVDRIE
jgi:legumain